MDPKEPKPYITENDQIRLYETKNEQKLLKFKLTNGKKHHNVMKQPKMTKLK